MTLRKGAAKGTGRGYKNLRAFPKDGSIHSQSARGMKQPQWVTKVMLSPHVAIKGLTPQQKKELIERVKKKGLPASMNYREAELVAMGRGGKDPSWDLPKVKYFGKTGKASPRGGKYAEKYQKTFYPPRGFKIEAHYEKTRNGYKHVARLYKDGVRFDEASVSYQGRTWESYEYETAIRALLKKTNALTPEEKQQFLGATAQKSHEEAIGSARTVGMVAAMGDIFGSTPKEKNDWKLRMIKAGMPGVEQPEDWNTLSEAEKSKRLDKIIALTRGNTP